MKHTKYAAIALAALAAQSCSNNEAIVDQQDQPKPITIAQTFVAKNGITRGTHTGDLDNQAIKAFRGKLWAVYFENNWDEPNAKWIYDNTVDDQNDGVEIYNINAWYSQDWIINGATKYWQSYKTYDFVAMTPAESDGIFNYNYNNGVFQVKNLPIVQTISNGEEKHGVDIMLSEVTRTNKTLSGNDGVNLKMHHVLSRLTPYVIAHGDTPGTVTLNALKICMPVETFKASYTQAEHYKDNDPNPMAGTWEFEAELPQASFTSMDEVLASTSGYKDYVVCQDCSIEVPENSQIDKTNAKQLDQSFFIAPTPADKTMPIYAYVKFTITPDGPDAKSQTHVRFVPIPVLDKFQQGYQHNLFINISAESIITFKAEKIDDWKEESSYADVTKD